MDAAKALGPFRQGRRSPSRHSPCRRCRQRATGRTWPLLSPSWWSSRLSWLLPAPSSLPWVGCPLRKCPPLRPPLTWQPPLSTFTVAAMAATSASHHSHGHGRHSGRATLGRHATLPRAFVCQVSAATLPHGCRPRGAPISATSPSAAGRAPAPFPGRSSAMTSSRVHPRRAGRVWAVGLPLPPLRTARPWQISPAAVRAGR